jgi:DnaJ-class molecular chaperone
MSKQFVIELGNTEERGGHRRDCAQIAVKLVCRKDQISDEAADPADQTPEAFLQTIRENLHDMTYELEIWEGFVAEITFNTKRVTVGDVLESCPDCEGEGELVLHGQTDVSTCGVCEGEGVV